MKSAAVARTVPVPLRLFHLVALFGFAASAIAAAGTELIQLEVALTHPYHSGTDPHWLAVAGAGLATLTLVVVVGGLAIGRPPPLLVSLGVLAGFGMALTGLSAEYAERSPHGANKKFLETGGELFGMVSGLAKSTGAAPDDPKAYEIALQQIAETQQKPSPYRKGMKEIVPYRVEMTAEQDTWPRTAPPGTVLVWVSPDRANYSLRFIGLDDFRQPALLKDELGRTFALRGGAKDDIF